MLDWCEILIGDKYNGVILFKVQSSFKLISSMSSSSKYVHLLSLLFSASYLISVITPINLPYPAKCFSNLYPTAPNLIEFLGILLFNWFETDELNRFNKCFGANPFLYNNVLTGLERNFLKNVGDDIEVFIFMYLFRRGRYRIPPNRSHLCILPLYRILLARCFLTYY